MSKPIKSYARTINPLELPSLIDIQLDSFETFTSESLAELFDEISPIESFNGNLKLYFPSSRPEVEGFDLKYWFGEPKYDVDECVERDMSYAAPLYVKVLLYRADLDQPIVQAERAVTQLTESASPIRSSSWAEFLFIFFRPTVQI